MSREPTTFIEGEIHEDEPLTVDELALRTALEKEIARDMESFVRVGKHLHEIRTKRLYRDFGTWTQYLREVFPVSLSESWASRLISAAEVHDVVPVPTERAARALRRARGDVQEVFHKAVENVGGDVQRITARSIAEADRQVCGEPTESQAIADELPARESVYISSDAARKELDAVVEHLRCAVKALKTGVQGCDAARWIDVRHVEQEIRRIGDHVKAARPYAKCSSCVASPGLKDRSPCDACAGCGWVPRFKHESLPAKRQGPTLD